MYFAYILKSQKTGRFFQKIGTVKAAGNSTFERQYGFLHQTSVTGVNYYRLRQVDLDGNFTYSNIATATLESTEDLQSLRVFPNPTMGDIFLEIPAKEDFIVELYDLLGQVVFSKNNIYKLNVQYLAAGEYFLKITDAITLKARNKKVVVFEK